MRLSSAWATSREEAARARYPSLCLCAELRRCKFNICPYSESCRKRFSDPKRSLTSTLINRKKGRLALTLWRGHFQRFPPNGLVLEVAVQDVRYFCGISEQVIH